VHFSNVKLCLGSASPRRAELLRQIGVEFEVRVADIDESVQDNEDPDAYVVRMAIEKARAAWRLNQNTALADLPVLAADTAVILDREILGKPENRHHGIEMLTRLSGRTHEVLSAVALFDGKALKSHLSRSQVTFRPLSEQEIDWYWATGEPADKAGAYAIQGKAALFIESLQGSYSGVMGLPLFEVGQLLDEMED